MTLIIYGIIGIIIIGSLENLIKNKSLDGINELLDALLNKLGVKWLVIIKVADHLSIGFFCLRVFSAIFQETLNIKKFYITSSIMAALYYALTINILKVLINNGFRNHIHEKIENSGYSFINNNSKDKIIKLFDDLIAYLSNFIADFLSTYNIFLEKLVIGTLYLFLFYEPKKLANNPKYLLVFRLLSLFPISFIIISLVLRALQNTDILVINEYVLSFLMGPKITIYGFFIS